MPLLCKPTSSSTAVDGEILSGMCSLRIAHPRDKIETKVIPHILVLLGNVLAEANSADDFDRFHNVHTSHNIPYVFTTKDISENRMIEVSGSFYVQCSNDWEKSHLNSYIEGPRGHGLHPLHLDRFTAPLFHSLNPLRSQTGAISQMPFCCHLIFNENFILLIFPYNKPISTIFWSSCGSRVVVSRTKFYRDLIAYECNITSVIGL